MTKNLSVMLQEAGYSAQDLMHATDDVGVRMAIFNGIVNETRHQVGDAAKLADELGGALSRTEESTRKVHRAIGAAIEGPLRRLLDTVQPILDNLAAWIERNKALVGGILTLATALAGLTASGAAWLLLVPRIGDALKLFTSGPVGWTILGLAALVTAVIAVKNAMKDAKNHQEKLADTYEKQGETARGLIDEYEKLKDKTNKTADEKQRLVDLSNQIIELFPTAVSGYDTEGKAILDVKKAQEEMNKVLEESIRLRQKLRDEQIKNLQADIASLEQQRADLLRQQNLELFGGRTTVEDQNKYLRQKLLLEGYDASVIPDRIVQMRAAYMASVVEVDKVIAERQATLKALQEKPLTKEAGGGGSGGDLDGGADGISTQVFNTKELLSALETELLNIDKVAAVFGDTSNVAKDKASALRKAAITLIENGIDPTNTAMGNLVEQHKGYAEVLGENEEDTYDLVAAKTKLFKALEDIDQQAAVFGETLDTDRERLNLFQKAIIDALLNKKPIENIQDLIDEYNALKKEIDDATTAEQNNKEATDLLTQAQEYLYRMTGKVVPEWERFAQNLEEMAGKDGVLPEVAAQLREIADQIRGAGSDTGTTNKFVDMFVNMGDKIEEAKDKFERFRNGLIDGLTDAIMKGEDFISVIQQVANELARMFVRKGIETFINFMFPPLSAAHTGALVTPYGLVQDLPSFHSGGTVGGLRNDERIIKVLTGERVLSRGQNAAYEAGMKPQVKVDIINNTGTPIQAEPEVSFDGAEMVVSLLLEGHRRNINGIQKIFPPGRR